MKKPCVVPKCKSGYPSETSKHSLFRVRINAEQLQKWLAAIPGIVALKPTHVVCDNDFNERDIIREWSKRDANGQVIARHSYDMTGISVRVICPGVTETNLSQNSEGKFKNFVEPDEATARGQNPISSMGRHCAVAVPARESIVLSPCRHGKALCCHLVAPYLSGFRVERVEEALIEAIEKGENGSVWVTQLSERPFEIEVAKYESIKLAL